MSRTNEWLIERASNALDIADNGWAVFPCRGKRPITRHGFKDASVDYDDIMDWWMSDPDANVGVAIPDGVIVVDVDDMDAFADSGLDLPEAPGQNTPSGGLHRFYRLEAETPLQSVKKFPGVDTRVGGRGYVIAWDASAFSNTELPPAPAWVYR